MLEVELSTRVPILTPEGIDVESKKEEEYGKLTTDEFLYSTKCLNGEPAKEPVLDTPPYYISLVTYLNYLILIIFGHISDYLGMKFQRSKHMEFLEINGLAPWYSKFESFYARRMKKRIDDCFSRPTTGVPGRLIRCINRIPQGLNDYFTYSGETTQCLNLSSYNYLGFAQSEGQCTDAALASIERYGIQTGGPRSQVGTTELHLEVEREVAKFLGKDDAVIFSMGYSTNANFFNAFMDSKCLVLSDELNHTSIRTGVRLSGAAVRTFKHGDMNALESLIREQIVMGQPKTSRPWKKILICVEGLFSMEGTMCNLPELIELKKKYKCYLYMDEAHSIGAMGSSGRGIAEVFGVDTKDIDILMGTFTKSFGAAGGYIAADQWIIDRLRLDLTVENYGEPMPPPVLAQISSSLKTISGEICPGQGQERLQRIAFNSRYFRLALQRLGFIVYGTADSPVIPLLIYSPSKMPAFSRMMLQRRIAVVIVAYPATPLIESRVRFCMSASLTKEDIDYLLRHVDEVGEKLSLKLNSGRSSYDGKVQRWDIEEVIRRTPEDCKDDKYFVF